MSRGSSAAGPGAPLGAVNGGPGAQVTFCYRQGSPVLFGNQSIYNANGFGH